MRGDRCISFPVLPPLLVTSGRRLGDLECLPGGAHQLGVQPEYTQCTIAFTAHYITRSGNEDS